MFSGIVDHCARLTEVRGEGTGMRLHLQSRFSQLVPGESIAVDGVCLTVTECLAGDFWCDVSGETLSRTTLGGYAPGRPVNVERALCLGDRVGGHLVTGHVDRTAIVRERDARDGFVRLAIGGVAATETSYLVPKGSVAINGVSLTLNSVGEGGFELMLIPHTLGRTNLKELSVGDAVNLEFDWMVKAIINDARARGGL